MAYILRKTTGSYDDTYTENVSYTRDKAVAETLLARLKIQSENLVTAYRQLQALDPSYYEHLDFPSYSIEELEELKSDYLEIEYEVEE